MWQAPTKEKTEFPPLQSVSNTTPTELVQPEILAHGNMPEVFPASALARFDVEAATMAEIKKYQLIKVDIDDPGTVKLAKKAKSVTRDLRLKIQRRQKKINAEINKEKKDLKTDTTALTSEIKITEDHLATEIQKDIDHKEALKEEKRIIDEARRATIRQNMGTLQRYCEAGIVPGLSSEKIKAALAILENSSPPKGVFQELFQDACNLYNHGIDVTRAALAAREQWESEQAERDAQAAKLEQQTQTNHQHSWFNDVFGWDGTPEGMEDGLKQLESMTPPGYLVELVREQKLKAQDIIIKARAAKAEADRIEAERKVFADAETARVAAEEKRLTDEALAKEEAVTEARNKINCERIENAWPHYQAAMIAKHLPEALEMNKAEDKKQRDAMADDERRQMDILGCKSAVDCLVQSLKDAISSVSEASELPEFTLAVKDFEHNVAVSLKQLEATVFNMK